MEYVHYLKSKNTPKVLTGFFIVAMVFFIPSAYYSRMSLIGVIVWICIIIFILYLMYSSGERRDIKKFMQSLKTRKRGASVMSYDFFLITEDLNNDRRFKKSSEFDFYKELRKRLSNPKKYLKKQDNQDQIKLAQVAIPRNIETLHFAISASTGAGKSIALRGLLRDIARRGDRAIVIDNGGEFSKLFKDKDSLFLSPFDPRSQHWNMKNEVKQPYDWMRLAKSIVPDASGNEKSWHDMAQKLIANIGLQTGADNKTLLEIATSFTPAQLEPILKGTSSAVLLQDGGERLLTNIRSVFSTYMQCWQFMRGGNFSLKEYVQGNDKRWLWLPFQESELGVSKDLIASWLDVIVSAGLEREENSQMTWVIIDELDTLGCIGSLIDATTKLRKRNMPIVTAFQAYSQLETNYGKERAATLFNCFSSKLILRTVDGITAEHLSKELGDAETWKTSYSTGQNSSHTDSLQLERVVLPSEIQSLPDLQGYLRLAGDYPIIKTGVSLADAGI